MEWLIAGLVTAGALFLLLWWLGTRSDPHRRGGGVTASFMTGVAEELDPRAALVRSENEKRLEMEGEQDSGDPKEG